MNCAINAIRTRLRKMNCFRPVLLSPPLCKCGSVHFKVLPVHYTDTTDAGISFVPFIPRFVQIKPYLRNRPLPSSEIFGPILLKQNPVLFFIFETAEKT